jgi:hypothetical protein
MAKGDPRSSDKGCLLPNQGTLKKGKAPPAAFAPPVLLPIAKKRQKDGLATATGVLGQGLLFTIAQAKGGPQQQRYKDKEKRLIMKLCSYV